MKEAREDIPPLYRARVWAALLKVDSRYSATYAAIEKEKSHPSDRQVSFPHSFGRSFVILICKS